MVHVEVRTSPTKKTLLPCLFGYLIFSVNSFPPCSPQRVGGIRPKTLCGRISPRFVADGGRFPPKDVADPPRRVAEGWGVLKKNTPHLFTWDTSSPPRGEKKSLNRSFFGLCLFAFALTLHLHVPNAVAVTKQEVLKKYEQVIVRSNQMNIYGYDLGDVTFKLKRLTEVLVADQFDRADDMLSEIERDLKSIEAKGPEHLRRERALVWMEIFGDFIQQIAIFVLLALLLFRFRFLKSAVAQFDSTFSSLWKITVVLGTASLLGAGIGLIRYGQSSWSFIDLQIIFIGLSGLVGGVAVGFLTGVVNSAFRFLIIPGASVYSLVPLAIGVVGGLVRRLQREPALRPLDIIAGGLVIGVLHSFFMYAPIFSYLPLRSFLTAVFLLSIVECGFVVLFFRLAWHIFKEEKRKEMEQELVRTRLRFLQAQINPHFLFNTLNTIAAVCGEENAERARQLIIQLSTFFRRITKQESDCVSLRDEFEYIDAYLEIEQARFRERLQVEKHIELSRAGYGTLVPILAIQPIVENAIKHGLSKKAEGGKLVINAKEEDSRIVIEVHDTGIGMSEEVKQHLFEEKPSTPPFDRSDKGIGLANIRERLGRFYDRRFQMSLSSARGEGTTVTLSLPKGS